jgi:hypothetical protein
MAEDAEIDQQVYDDLIAQGKSERIARSKAKAAAIKAKKAQEPAEAEQSSGDGQPAETAGAGQAAASQPAATAQGGGTATAEAPAGGPMTPEQRQARVAQALAEKGGNGEQTEGQAETKFKSQEQTHRLLAMVPPTGIQQIRGKQEDKVYTWPHLISAEFISLLAMTAFVVVFSSFAPAPLRELANPNMTPNPSKAPWYFLGLQELLRYFHPMVAGVMIPGIGLLGLAMFPYMDKNPSVKPENRRTAITFMTFFLVAASVLVMAASFFRGPGFNWVWPWVDGIWFTL